MCEGGRNLKIGWNRTEWRGHKDFKGGGGWAGSWDGFLKKGGGLEPPYKLWVIDFEICGFHRNLKIQVSQEQNIFSFKNKCINHTSRATLWQK